MLGRKVTLILFSNILSTILGYVALYFIAQNMGPVPYGIMAFGFGYVHLLIFLTNMGFRQAHMKRVSEGRDLGKCIGTWMYVKLFLIFVYAMTIIGSVLVWENVLGHGFETANHKYVIYIMLAFAVINQLALIPAITFLARKEVAKKQIPEMVNNMARALSFIFVALAVADGADGEIWLAFAYIPAALIMLVMGWWFMRGYPITKPDKPFLKSYISFAIPVMPVSTLMNLTKSVDKVMIQAFWGAKDVAFYAVSQRLMWVVQFIVIALRSLIFPTYAEMAAKGDIDGIRRMAANSERLITMSIVPLLTFFFVLPERVIHIMLSDEFLNAALILQILAIWVFLVAINVPYNSQILAMDEPKLKVFIGVTAGVMNIGLNCVFIPNSFMGLPALGLRGAGAALATLCSQVFMVVALRYYCYKLTGSRTYHHIFVFLLGGAMMGLSMLLFDSYIPLERWYLLAGVGLAGFGIYMGSIAFMREFTRDDLDFFLDSFHPIRMLRYINSELRGKKNKGRKGKGGQEPGASPVKAPVKMTVKDDHLDEKEGPSRSRTKRKRTRGKR